MDPYDSAEQPGSSLLDDGTSDWLWDVEDRYDLGADDQNASPLGAGAADPRVASVRKRVRSRDGHGATGDRGGPDTSGPSTMPVPTTVVGPPSSAPGSARASYPPRRRVRRTTVLAAVLIVAGLAGLAYTALGHGSRHSNGPNLAISTPTTPPVTLGPVAGAIIPGPDTTAAAAPTTGAPGTTAAGAPGPAPLATGPAQLVTTGSVAPGRAPQPQPPTATPPPGTTATTAPPVTQPTPTTPAPTTATTVPTTHGTPPPTTSPTVPPTSATTATTTAPPSTFPK